MNLVVNLYIVLLHCCIVLLNFLLIFAVKLCLIILVVDLYIVFIHLLVYWCNVQLRLQ